jgi:hypothetical protein
MISMELNAPPSAVPHPRRSAAPVLSSALIPSLERQVEVQQRRRCAPGLITPEMPVRLRRNPFPTRAFGSCRARAFFEDT